MASKQQFVLGLNATKSHIAYALVTGIPTSPVVQKADRISIVDTRPTAIVHHLCGIFDSLAAEHYQFDVAICECSSGSMGSSVAAIKAEALIEYACEKHGLKYLGVHPNSFRRSLGCTDGEKWQQKAKEVFNDDGAIKYFGTGVDGAAAAAFRRLKDGFAGKI